MAADGSIRISAELDSEPLERSLGALRTSVERTLGSAAKTAAASMAAIGAGLAAAAGAAVKTGSNFEAAMSQVAATMGKSSADIGELTALAKEMGEKTRFSATQAAEALNYLALAGYDSKKSIAALPKILDLAAAGGMELARASDLVTDSMSALGLKTSDLASFNDRLAKTSQKSNTSVARLGEAILTVGGSAKTLSGGVTEMNAALGLLADNGVKGAEGGTALRNIIASLTSPTDKAVEALESLGISVAGADGNTRPLRDVLKELNGGLADMGGVARADYLSKIFNARDLKSINALLATTGERWDQLTGEIENSAGAAAEQASTMLDNLRGDVEIMKSALEGLSIAFYDGMQVPARNAVKTATAEIGKLAAALKSGGLDGFINQLGASFGVIADLFVKQIPAFAEAAAKVAAALANSLIGNMPIVVESAKKVSAAILAAVFGADIVPAVNKFFDSVSKAVSGFANAVTPVFAPLGAIIKGAFEFILNNADVIIAALSGVAAAMAAMAVVSVIQGAAAAFGSAAIAAQAYGAGVTLAQITTYAFSGATGVLGVVMAVLTGKITLATAAQWLYNAAVTANPAGIAVVAVGALVGAFVLIANSAGEAADELSAFRDRLDEQIKKTEELSAKTQDSAKAYKETAESAKSAAKVNSELAASVAELAGKSFKSAGDMALLKARIDRLNEAVPGLNLAFDEQSRTLSLTVEYIAAIIERNNLLIRQENELARIDELKAERNQYEAERVAYLERRTELLAKIEEYERKAREALSVGYSTGYDASRDYDQAMISAGGYRAELEKLDAALGSAEGALSALDAELQSVGNSASASADAIAETEKALSAASKERERVYDAIIAGEERISKAESAAQKARADLADAEKRRLDLMQGAYENYFNDVVNGFKRLNAPVKQSMAELTGALDANLAQTKEWSGGLQKLIEADLAPSVVDELRKMGVDSLGIVRGMVEDLQKNGPEGVRRFNEKIERAVKDGQDAAAALFGDENFSGGVINEWEKIGKQIEDSKAIAAACENEIAEAKNAVAAAVKSADFVKMGLNISEGVAQGIRNGQNLAVNAAANAVKAAYEAARAAGGIQSPSKLTSEGVGEPLAEGVAAGIKKGEAAAAAAVKNLVAKTGEIAKTENERVLRDNIFDYQSQIAALEQKIKEESRLEETAAKERAVAEAKTGEELAKARKTLNEAMRGYALEDLRERQKIEEQKLKAEEEARRKERAVLAERADAYSQYVKRQERQVFLLGRQEDYDGQVLVYRDMLAKIDEEKRRYKESGLAETSDEIIKLEEQWYKYGDEITKIYQNQKNENLKIIKDFAYDDVNFSAETSEAKLKLFDAEYIARVRAIDEELAAFLEMNNAEIDAIIQRIALTDSEAAAALEGVRSRQEAVGKASDDEKAAREASEKAAREAEYQKRILEAETFEERRKREDEFAEYLENEAYKAREKRRRDELKALEEEQKAILQAAREKNAADAKLAAEKLKNAETEVVSRFEAKPLDLESELELQSKSKEQLAAYYSDVNEARAAQESKITADRRKAYESERKDLETHNKNLISSLESFYGRWYNAGRTFMEALIAGINSRAAEFNAVMDSLADKLASLGAMDRPGPIPAFGSGGVITRPTLAVVGDVPEAIIPLDKLNALITGMAYASAPYLYGGASEPKQVNFQQTVVIQSPERTPAQNARALREAGKELADGL